MITGIKTEPIDTLERLVQCVPVLIGSYNSEPWNDNWNTESATAILRCCYHTPGFMGWIALSGTKIIACGIGNIEPYFTGDIFCLKQLFVAVGHQKAGVGKLLIAAMKHDLAVLGIVTIVVVTSAKVFEFYGRCGFNEVAGMRMMLYDEDAETSAI